MRGLGWAPRLGSALISLSPGVAVTNPPLSPEPGRVPGAQPCPRGRRVPAVPLSQPQLGPEAAPPALPRAAGSRSSAPGAPTTTPGSPRGAPRGAHGELQARPGSGVRGKVRGGVRFVPEERPRSPRGGDREGCSWVNGCVFGGFWDRSVQQVLGLVGSNVKGVGLGWILGGNSAL